MILDEQVLHVVDSVCPCSVCFSLSLSHRHTHIHSYSHTILFPSKDYHMLRTAGGQSGQVDFFDLRLRVIICPGLRSTCFFPLQYSMFCSLVFGFHTVTGTRLWRTCPDSGPAILVVVPETFWTAVSLLIVSQRTLCKQNAKCIIWHISILFLLVCVCGGGALLVLCCAHVFVRRSKTVWSWART